MSLRPNLTKLLELASPALGPDKPELELDLETRWGALGAELQALLRAHNGFFAFESALLVRPSEAGSGVRSLTEWNAPNLWIDAYDDLASDLYFFAEDLFGGQFCLSDEGVVAFDPETGETEVLGTSLEEFAGALLEEFDVLTGQPLAHEWQEDNGALPTEKRLLPKIPFVIEGEYVLDNLIAIDSVKGMRFRASIALQIRDLPEGTEIELAVIE